MILGSNIVDVTFEPFGYVDVHSAPNITTSGGGEGGTSVHGDLTGRSAADSHPVSAITGLQAALDGKATTAQGAKADTAVQPADLTVYATDAELAAGLATKAATSHTHATSDVTGLDAALAAAATDADLAAHAADTTAVHGIADTSALVLNGDSRLSDARTPTAHNHAAADVTSGTFAVARLGTGTPAASTYVDGATGAWTALPSGGTADHGALTGLGDDDHTQYALADGSRGSFATTAQGTLAGTASQPGHAHAGADITSGTVAYARLPVGTTASTVAAGDDSRIVGALQASTAQAINAQTGTSYTLVSGDAGKVVTLSNAGAITLNAPGSTFTTGQRVDVVVIGAGMATVVGTSGATANGTPSLVSRAQWSAFTILWTSATACVVIGDMA